MKNFISLLAACLLLAPVAARAAATPAGIWEGTLKTPNGEFGFLFNIHRDGEKWAAEMDVPAQGVSELPLKDVKVDGGAVGFPLPGAGEPHYDGKLSDDGKTISGKFSVADTSFPLDLKWKSEPRAVSKVQPNSGEVGVLEGVWEGSLDAGGTLLHVRFTFTKDSSGDISATFDSVDQGASGLPVGTISRTGDTVKWDLKAISGSYEGTLDKDASTITGNLTQNGGSMPLNLQRKKAEKKS